MAREGNNVTPSDFDSWLKSKSKIWVGVTEEEGKKEMMRLS